jgi:4-diphosphocytidyl-2-C-methyl-D-erythritol kinase
MISFPNAKVNIGLSVTSKRADGFHNLESIFYPIDWCDVLEIVKADEMSFVSSGISIPGAREDNLCMKAYNLLKKEFDLPFVAINLKKLIPIGAGLGGGSADASYTLKMLNTMFCLGLSENQLEEKAKELGSDCAFFIQNKAVVATEKGDTFGSTKLNLVGYYILLVYPDIHISTQEAYQGVVPSPSLVDYSAVESLKEEVLHNDFEKGVFSNHPEIEALKIKIKKDAFYTSMTGSGSTVFGIFESKPDMQQFSDYTCYLEQLKY